jgi:hypothetical protein
VSAFTHLRTVRMILAAGVALRALAWGLATALTLIIGAAVADMATPLDVGVRLGVSAMAIVAAVSVAGALLWNDRSVASLERVALWVEERFPTLEYSLVTAVTMGRPQIAANVESKRWTTAAARRVLRAVGEPALAIAIAAAVVVLLPAGAVARVRSPHAGDALARVAGRGGAAASRLTPLVAQIVPPAYSGEKASGVDEPTDVRALVGSVVTLRGRGDGSSVVVHAGKDEIGATTRGDRWEIVTRMPPQAIALRLTDRSFSRVIAIEPIVDNPPSVTLATPAHDTVLRIARGRIPLQAQVSDDYGVSSASFEFIISSGEGETFTFRSGVLGAVRPGSRTAALSASLSVDSLKLKPGDIVHVRAVARDGNNVSGPGSGVSDTRAIRIARVDEYDSVAVDAAAPSEAEKGLISERMLIMLAEALEQKRPSLKRDVLVGESHSIAVDQTRLRRSVGDIVFTRLGGTPSGEEHSGDDAPTRAKSMSEMLARADSATNRSSDPIDFEGGESPVVAVNKPLLQAYNEMWDASTSLEMGEPAKALPHMRRALAAIQLARQAERIYLRGTPPAVVIDISKARLKGKDKGFSSTRRALSSTDSAGRVREERFGRLIELSTIDAQAAADSLLILRIDALADNPAFATALSDAAAAVKRGRGAGASSALARARRALSGSSVARDSLPRWGIVP